MSTSESKPDTTELEAPPETAASTGLTEEERESVGELTKPRAAVIYEIIRAEGRHELSRSTSALWWSGLAAGLSISFSMLAEALLMAYLPDTDWRPIAENFGYCVGFLIVVLGRQQLFTENTITAVLPLAATPSWLYLRAMLRLWGIVFAANLVGCFVFALYIAKGGVLHANVVEALLELCRHLMDNTPVEMFTKGIIAGWLIAAMVWMLPSSDGASSFFVIVLATYLIALGDFTHVVAGSAEVFYLVIHGEVTLSGFAGEFLVPTFFGNVVGGTALFALLAFGQVHDEIEPARKVRE